MDRPVPPVSPGAIAGCRGLTPPDSVASADGVTRAESGVPGRGWTGQPRTAPARRRRIVVVRDYSGMTGAPSADGCRVLLPPPGRAVPDQPVEGEAADVRTVHRPSPPCRRPGPRRGPDAQPQLHRHRAHPPGLDPRG